MIFAVTTRNLSNKFYFITSVSLIKNIHTGNLFNRFHQHLNINFGVYGFSHAFFWMNSGADHKCAFYASLKLLIQAIDWRLIYIDVGGYREAKFWIRWITSLDEHRWWTSLKWWDWSLVEVSKTGRNLLGAQIAWRKTVVAALPSETSARSKGACSRGQLCYRVQVHVPLPRWETSRFEEATFAWISASISSIWRIEAWKVFILFFVISGSVRISSFALSTAFSSSSTPWCLCMHGVDANLTNTHFAFRTVKPCWLSFVILLRAEGLPL